MSENESKLDGIVDEVNDYLYGADDKDVVELIELVMEDMSVNDIVCLIMKPVVKKVIDNLDEQDSNYPNNKEINNTIKQIDKIYKILEHFERVDLFGNMV